MLQLAPGAIVVTDLVSVAGGGEVVQAANQLFLLARQAEDGGERIGRREVLPPLEMTLGPPEGPSNPCLGRRPVVLFGHCGRILESALVATVERTRSAERIEGDIETLAGPDYTLSDEAIRRYAYTRVYRNTLDYFTRELEAIGFEVYEDPVGTLVGRNRPRGERVFGVGSHCDSNRNGGKYDGTMGVVTALEVCRLNEELGLGLPLQLVSFLEEEGSGFGQMLLGSRIIAQRVSEEELKESFRAIDDGRSFWEHAEAAGYEPARWRECSHVLDDLTGWIEMHIEQARVLQDTGNRIGIVNAIAGYVHADVVVQGRGDHAGATPMDLRLDPTLPLSESIAEL